MSPAVHYVRVGAEVRGPLRVEQLREMATIEVLTAGSEIAASAAGPWVRVGSLPLWDKIKPVPPEFAFKGNAFKAVNPDTMLDSLSLAGRERGQGGPTGSEPMNEVQRMVQDVNERAAAHAPTEILPPVPSTYRFVRWLLPLALVGSALILVLPKVQGRSYDSRSVRTLMRRLVLYNGTLLALVMLERRQKELVREHRMRLEQRDGGR